MLLSDTLQNIYFLKLFVEYLSLKVSCKTFGVKHSWNFVYQTHKDQRLNRRETESSKKQSKAWSILG